MRSVRSLVVVAIIGYIMGITPLLCSAEGAPIQSDNSLVGGSLILQAGTWSDFSGRGGELKVSFPIWSGSLYRIDEVKTLVVVGMHAQVDKGTVTPANVQLRASSEKLEVTLGQGNVRWGAGKYATLILGDRALYYPFVQAKATADTKFGKVEYSRLMGKLGPQPDTYLLGQRLDIYLRSWLRLGVSEIAIANNRFVSIPTNSIPLWPFYLTQHLAIHSGAPGVNEDSNENLALDATVVIRPGTVLYGEFFVDDMPQRPQNPGVYQIAFLVGGTTEVGTKLKLDAEYARVNNYTYTFRNPDRSYLNQGRPLGFQLGPDTDRLIVMLWRQFEKVEIGAGVDLRRRGEGRIGDKWQDIGWQEARKRSFLYGVVEETSLVRGEAIWEFANGSQIEGGIAIGRVNNKDNVPGISGTELEWNIGIRYGFDSY